MRVAIFACTAVLLAACSKDCSQINNPVTPDYPCGTRAHACSTNPLMCCLNTDVCGGPIGSGCPAGMCCYIGDDYGAGPRPSAQPGARSEPQWRR